MYLHNRRRNTGGLKKKKEKYLKKKKKKLPESNQAGRVFFLSGVRAIQKTLSKWLSWETFDIVLIEYRFR